MEPEWHKIYLSLVAYADQVLKSKKWFRGRQTDSYLAGKQAKDYALEAIEIYLTNPEKYDPKQMSLLGYLKSHIVRRAIGNDSKLLENRISSDTFKNQFADNDDYDESFDLIMPYQEALFDQQMDVDLIMDFIAERVQHDPVLVKLYHGHCLDRLDRGEVMEVYKLTADDYDNGIRRLKTIFKVCVKKFRIEIPNQAKKGRSKPS